MLSTPVTCCWLQHACEKQAAPTTKPNEEQRPPATVLQSSALAAATTPAGPSATSTNGSATAAAAPPTLQPAMRARARSWRFALRPLVGRSVAGGGQGCMRQSLQVLPTGRFRCSSTMLHHAIHAVRASRPRAHHAAPAASSDASSTTGPPTSACHVRPPGTLQCVVGFRVRSLLVVSLRK